MLGRIIQVLSQEGSIAILPHVSADGDAIGSSISLSLALKKINKSAKIILEEKVASTYEFLPGIDTIEVYNADNMASGVYSNYSTVIALDTGDIGRLGARSEIFKNALNTVNVDHHITNSKFAEYNHVDITSSSTGEIIYELLRLMGIQLDTAISSCLYVAIATDTGGFRYSNTTSKTHEITGALINNGVDIAYISKIVFDTTSLGRVKLMGAAINTLQFYENNKIAFMTVTDEILQQSGAADEDLEGIINIARNIIGVETAVVFKQKSINETKASLRSNYEVDVAQIAVKFGGGGHKRAAGFTTESRIEDIKCFVLDEIRKQIV